MSGEYSFNPPPIGETIGKVALSKDWNNFAEIPMFTASQVSQVAQMAAFFAEREGGKIHTLKLIKLMYLADRESMWRHGWSISFDVMVSMPNGPVLSQVYDLINGCTGGVEGEKWDDWISARSNHMVSLRRKFARDDCDRISQADWDVLEHVWSEFGSMDQWQLRDYTHEHCSEWSDPTKLGKQSFLIKDIDILRAVGIAEDEAILLAEDIEVQRGLDETFARAARDFEAQTALDETFARA